MLGLSAENLSRQVERAAQTSGGQMGTPRSTQKRDCRSGGLSWCIAPTPDYYFLVFKDPRSVIRCYNMQKHHELQVLLKIQNNVV